MIRLWPKAAHIQTSVDALSSTFDVMAIERVRWPRGQVPTVCVILDEPVNLCLLYIPCMKLETFSTSSQRLA